MRILKYWQAISEGLVQSMEADPAIFVAGAGVDDSRGIFGTTLEATRRFGSKRVFDIPNCENAFTGIAIGAAAAGKRPVIVHARADFMFLAFDQILNLAAKWKYMLGGRTEVPVVFLAVVGRGWGQGATHSQSPHALFSHFPGLQVAAPAFPADAKGLVVSALRGHGPAVILEHRSCFELEAEVPEEAVAIPFGRARVVRAGADVTIVGASVMAYEALRAADVLAEQGVRAEVIDVRSTRPLDEDTILASLARTGRLVVADTTWAPYGLSAEIAAIAAEKGWDLLKAPVRRVTPPDCPSPVSKPLEDAFYPSPVTIAEACLSVLQMVPLSGSRPERAHERFLGPY